MPTLLLEIGCEELPASACCEAEAQLPELVRSASRASSRRSVFVGAAPAWRSSSNAPPASAISADSGQGPAVRRGARQAAAGFARSTGVTADELEERDGLLGVERAGAAAGGEVAAGAARRDRPRARVRQVDALGRERHALLAAGALAAREARRARRSSRLAARHFGHRFTRRARSPMPSARPTSRRCARRASSRTRRSAAG